MTVLGPAAIVTGVPLTPPPISLLTAAGVVDETGERWENGFNYIAESCGAADAFLICNNDPITGFQKTVTAARSTPITGTPYGIVAQDTATTFGWAYRDYAARATRKLLSVESYMIAKELWNGTLGINPKFADPLAVIAPGTGAAPESLLTAISSVEQAFFDVNPGTRCYIHMRPNILQTLQNFSGGDPLRRVGNVYYTQMDSVCCVDRGYPGTGPAGQAVSQTQEWIYATPPIQVRHGPVMVTPTSMKEATDRKSNQVTFFAERAVHAGWDYGCTVVALNVKRNA